MTTTPKTLDKCPWCGARRIGNKMPITFDCSSIVVPDRDDKYVRRTDSCYERELSALRAKLAAQGALLGEAYETMGDSIDALEEFTGFTWLPGSDVPNYNGAISDLLAMRDKIDDALPMADTEGGES